MSPWQRVERDGEEQKVNHVAIQLSAALAEKGYQVDQDVGQSHFRCDLAVRRNGDDAYCLGIVLDDDEYYQQSDLLERDVMRPRLLRHFGWNVATVLAKDWYNDATSILERLINKIENDQETDDDDEPEECELQTSEEPDDESTVIRRPDR